MTTSKTAARVRPAGRRYHLPRGRAAVRRRRIAATTLAIIVGLVTGFVMSRDDLAPVAATGPAASNAAGDPATVATTEPAIPAWAQRPAVAPTPTLNPDVQGDGSLLIASGGSEAVGSGVPRRFLVEVEEGLGVKPSEFAEAVEEALFDRRSWARNGTPLQRVDREPVDFRVTLASTGTTDRLCAQLDTRGRYSCWNSQRAVINFMRWVTGHPDFGNALDDYRRYAINHEVGHALGHGHETCPEPGALAPVMMQQSKGVGSCRPNPWPHP